jgi:hypothetical protein
MKETIAIGENQILASGFYSRSIKNCRTTKPLILMPDMSNRDANALLLTESIEHASRFIRAAIIGNDYLIGHP